MLQIPLDLGSRDRFEARYEGARSRTRTVRIDSSDCMRVGKAFHRPEPFGNVVSLMRVFTDATAALSARSCARSVRLRAAV